MPVELLATTQTEYSEALTLGPSQQISQIAFAVSAPNAAKFQIAKLDKAGQASWDENEFTVQPGTGQFVEVYGMRFRSFDPANPTTVLMQAYFADDPTPIGLVPGLSSFNPTPTPGPPPAIVVQQVPPVVTPIWVPDPGAGVSSIVLYTVPADTLTTFKLVTYRVLWDISGGLGDRAILYEIVDPNGGGPGVPEVLAYGQSGNVVYTEASTPDTWLETDVGTMGNFFRTINNSIAEIPFNSGVDFEGASAPFGDVEWPEGFILRLTVPHMAGTDEVDSIRLLVSERSAS